MEALLLLLCLEHDRIFWTKHFSRLSGIFFASIGGPNLVKISNETILLASNIFRRLAKLLIENGEHVLLVEAEVALEHLDQYRINILRLDR